MSEKKEAEPTEEGAKPKSKKKLIIIVAVVLILVVGGGVGFMALGGSKEEEKAGESHEEEVKHLETAKLDTFVVNLAGSGAFLKMGIMLEYDAHILEEETKKHGAAGGGGEAEGGHGGGGLPGLMGHKEPMIRDAVIRVLSSKRGEEVMGPDGKDTLKEEIVEAINEALGLEEPTVTGMYITEFLVQ